MFFAISSSPLTHHVPNRSRLSWGVSKRGDSHESRYSRLWRGREDPRGWIFEARPCGDDGHARPGEARHLGTAKSRRAGRGLCRCGDVWRAGGVSGEGQRFNGGAASRRRGWRTGGEDGHRRHQPDRRRPPSHGVLKFFTNLDESLLERLQREFPGAHLVKAFNSVGNTRMVNPAFANGKPTMFICGNDAEAKRTVTRVLDQFGWETEDMGMAE